MPPSRWTFCLDDVITEPWASVEDWVLRANPGMPITPVLLAVSWDVRWAEATAEPAVPPTAEVAEPGMLAPVFVTVPAVAPTVEPTPPTMPGRLAEEWP